MKRVSIVSTNTIILGARQHGKTKALIDLITSSLTQINVYKVEEYKVSGKKTNISGVTPKPELLERPKQLFRFNMAGVICGEIVKEEGQKKWIKDALKIHYWEGALDTFALAVLGTKKIEQCRISETVPMVLIDEAAVEQHDMSPKAIEIFYTANPTRF